MGSFRCNPLTAMATHSNVVGFPVDDTDFVSCFVYFLIPLLRFLMTVYCLFQKFYASFHVYERDTWIGILSGVF